VINYLNRHWDNERNQDRWTIMISGNGPTQTRWVQDTDSAGESFMAQTDYENDKKMFYPDGSRIEGFGNKAFWENYTKTLAGIVIAGLAFGLITYARNK
jgi:hypothetical protein